MIAAMLLVFVGTGDLLRARGRRVVRIPLCLIAWAGLDVAAVLLLGVHPVLAVAATIAAVVWSLVVSSDDAARPRGLWPVLALAVLVAVSATLVPDPAVPASTIAAYAATPLGAAGIPLRLAIGSLGGLLVLTRTGNLIARAALGRARIDDEPAPDRPAAWAVRIAGARVGSVEREGAPSAARTSVLRGGRLIGPIERILLVALALLGAPAVIAALIAAKGIVRFPEISDDRGTGSKAEEFLVGSLASWALSAGVVVLLLALR